MSGISALGTTYNLPNYGGELIALSRSSAKFLAMCGGLSGGVGGGSRDNEFEWQTYDLRSSTAGNTVAEGQDAPTLTGRVRSNVSNVCEIHHSAVGVSYTKQAAVDQKNGIKNTQANPVTSELAWQMRQELIAMGRDVNASFLTGVYNKAASTSDENTTRGIITAITTNVDDAAGDEVSYTSATTGVLTTSAAHGLVVGDTAIITSVTTNTEYTTDTPYYVNTVPSTTTFTLASAKGGSTITLAATGSGKYKKGVTVTTALVNTLMQDVFDNGGLSDEETFTLWCNSRVYLDLNAAYLDESAGFRTTSRNVGGVKLTTIITPFGMLNVGLEPQMPKHKLLVATMSECQPVFLDIPGKGHFFAEPLAKTGAQDKAQIYGEVGLKYGAESHHGVLKNLAAF